MQVPRLAETAALQAELAGQVIEPGTGAERRQGLHPQANFADVEGDWQSPRHRTLGRQARPVQDADVRRNQLVDLQPAPQQRAVAPAHGDVVGLQPDALLIGDGHLRDGEIAPDVAAEALQFQASHAAEPEPAGPCLYQQAALRRQRAIAHRQQGGGHDQHHGDQARDGPAKRGSRAKTHAARNCLGRAQKLCPMLI